MKFRNEILGNFFMCRHENIAATTKNFYLPWRYFAIA